MLSNFMKFCTLSLTLLASASAALDLATLAQKLIDSARTKNSDIFIKNHRVLDDSQEVQSHRALSACSESYQGVVMGMMGINSASACGDQTTSCSAVCTAELAQVQSTCQVGDVLSIDDDGIEHLYSNVGFRAVVGMFAEECASWDHEDDCMSAFEIFSLGIMNMGPCGHEEGATSCLDSCSVLLGEITGGLCQAGDVLSIDDDGTEYLYSSVGFGVAVGMFAEECVSWDHEDDCMSAFEIFSLGIMNMGPCGHEEGATSCLDSCSVLLGEITGGLCQAGDVLSIDDDGTEYLYSSAAFEAMTAMFIPACGSGGPIYLPGGACGPTGGGCSEDETCECFAQRKLDLGFRYLRHRNLWRQGGRRLFGGSTARDDQGDSDGPSYACACVVLH